MLITLAIIGIIAALTVPTLMNKVQDHSFRSAFFKTYSTIQNAYMQSIRDGIPFFDDTSSYISTHYLKNPLHTSKYCYEDPNNEITNYFKISGSPRIAYMGLCNAAIGYFYTPNNASDANINQIVKLLDGSQRNDWGSVAHNASGLAFKLQDGTIIGIQVSTYYTRRIFIDVNGPKKPNTIGRDIYFLQAIKTNGQYKIVPFGAPGTGGASGDISWYIKSGHNVAYEILKNRNYKLPK